MEEEFVPYEEALALRELNFNEPCFGIYRKLTDVAKFEFAPNSSNSDFISIPTAPTWGAAFRWFREKHKLHGMHTHNSYMIEGEINGDFLRITKFSLKSYEEAELECLRKLIEIAKETK